MLFREPNPDCYSEVNLDLIDRVEHLPFNPAFEQLMYQNLCRRDASFSADEPISISPRLMKTQFPEQLTGLFLEDEPIFDGLRASLATSYDKTSEYTLGFTVGDRDFQIETSGDSAICTVQGYDGPLTYRLPRDTPKALLAALVYASQYDARTPEKSITLAEDSVAQRDEQDDAGDVEAILKTLGNTSGVFHSETVALFDTPSGIIEAHLNERESPHVNMLSNSLSHSDILTLASTTTLRQQQTVIDTSDVTMRFARRTDGSLPGQFEDIDPLKDHEKWLEVCQLFYGSIEADLTLLESQLGC